MCCHCYHALFGIYFRLVIQCMLCVLVFVYLESVGISVLLMVALLLYIFVMCEFLHVRNVFTICCVRFGISYVFIHGMVKTDTSTDIED